MTGYYDKNKNWIDRPECMKKLYDKLVRAAKKLAPYTEIVDEITAIWKYEEGKWQINK